MSFLRYPAYKDSGVEWLGDVPAHWTLTKTKYVADFHTGWTPPTGDASSYDGENLWANISDLGVRVLNDTAKRVSDDAIRASRIRCSPAGSLLFSFKLSIGGVSFAGKDMYTNEAIATFLPNERIDLTWAYYAFPLFLIANAAENIYGAKLLNQELIRSANLPCLPCEEQTAIATFLDRETAKIDALVADYRTLIELLQEKRQAVISQAVTKGLDPTVPMKDSGLEWLGEVPEKWAVCRLGSGSEKITNGYVGPTRDIFVDDGIRYLQSLHIKNNKICFEPPYFVTEEWSESHAKSILREGDVLIVQTGDIGQVAAVPAEFIGCNCHALILLSPKPGLSGAWIALALNSDYGRHSLLSIQTGALHPHLNCGNVKDLKIPVPPEHEQADIIRWLVDVTNSVDSLIEDAQEAIALLQERRTALISAAVTGKIDVRPLVQQTEEAA